MLALAITHLSAWISALLTVMPLRSQATFVELLCGCLVSNCGWTTAALGAIDWFCHWTAYYKLIERPGLSPPRLTRATMFVVAGSLTPGGA